MQFDLVGGTNAFALGLGQETVGQCGGHFVATDEVVRVGPLSLYLLAVLVDEAQGVVVDEVVAA